MVKLPKIRADDLFRSPQTILRAKMSAKMFRDPNLLSFSLQAKTELHFLAFESIININDVEHTAVELLQFKDKLHDRR